MDWLDVVTRFVLPPILGGAGGLVIIWANWGIEKRRFRIQHRQKLVDSWRTVLLPLLEQPQDLGKATRKYPFMRPPEYASLRPHLSAELVQDLEKQGLRIDVAKTERGVVVIGDFPRRKLIEEIARIERVWRLV